MTLEAGDLEHELVTTLEAAVADRLPGEDPLAYGEFVRQYYHWVPAQDLAGRRPADLCGGLVAHWQLARVREPGAALVRVGNPSGGTDGWESPFTVVEIVSDDMPFIVDSLTMELRRQGYGIDLMVHPVMRVVRDPDGEITEVLHAGAEDPRAVPESIIRAEVAREIDPTRLAVLHSGLELVLEEVRAAVEDWAPMREQALALAQELADEPDGRSERRDEAVGFLRWLAQDNFTFLGYREYDLHVGDGAGELRPVVGTGLGILRGAAHREVTELSNPALALALSGDPLVLTKANSRATVHRPSHMDYVSVKRRDADGHVTGGRRFLGLYTTRAYKSSPREIPLLRDKVERVITQAAFPPDSHDAKGLVDILESLPRDLLVQVGADELFELAMGILGLGERPRVRLFVTHDSLGRFVDCTLCLPRDRFNTQNRLRAGRILSQAFAGDEIDWRLHLSESLIVRVDYIVHCSQGIPEVDVGAIEALITEATRNWTDDLRAALVTVHGQEEGTRLLARYRQAFPANYQADQNADAATSDIERLERLIAGRRPILTLYRRLFDAPETVRAQLLSFRRVSLSEVVPTFEHMGARVVDERPYEITPVGETPVWIYDFGLSCEPAGLARAGDAFAEVFLGVWDGELEDDSLNALVTAAGLTLREISLMRAIARYLRQAAIAFSNAYMTRTLLAHPRLVIAMVELFRARFDPDAHDPGRADALAREIDEAIDAVQSLDEDRILRSFLAVINAMLRTNYFRAETAAAGPDSPALPGYLSFKLDPSTLEMLPLPRPAYEIFVYSPRVEGIHLRGGKVARGGLRWSDRREDFRTEVLGLMKAQMVKNALIVPVGSKGGFVVKRPPAEGGQARTDEAIACYRTFLCGLLDLTDNYVGGEVVGPDRVVRYDDADPYLVVAADKGTASFSDIANQVSSHYGFWLGDAFASGGSHGYDHKVMGITARGAWESVRRHFRELGTDVSTEPFTVVGIGDMSGDVFGNGMLLSPHIRLLAAFNHAHVFLDPDPDPATSFAERRRLFALPLSSWSDYDPSLISAGGGVYRRGAKSIRISPQVREALDIDAERLAPTELIRRLLRAPVDLLFNGGIGTYVKASTETHAQAGDRANDSLRVDGRELRCRVVGEGGNLGLTQAGRVQYALQGGPDGAGGRINTDAIDNVAGVNCSDHEVNIKILLSDVVHSGRLDDDGRNALLRQMTEAVAQHVIYGSYTQTQAMSVSLSQATSMLEVHGRLIDWLVARGLDRELEALPSQREIETRHAERRGLVAPELAVLLAHCKMDLQSELLASELPEEAYLAEDLARYFPPPLAERYPEAMASHRLRRELVATIVANQLVDRAGPTFAFRLGEETGATAAQLARAYTVARDVFHMPSFWAAVEALDNEVDAVTQLAMLREGRRLVERAARWLVRFGAYGPGELGSLVTRFEPAARMLAGALPGVLRGMDHDRFEERLAELGAVGVPEALARRVASMPALLSVFDIVVDAAATDCRQELVMDTYFAIGARLELDWLRDQILELPRDDRWQALARAALRDELYRLHRAMTRAALALGPAAGGDELTERWVARNQMATERAIGVLADIRASRASNTTTLPVALRELKAVLGDGYGLS